MSAGIFRRRVGGIFNRGLPSRSSASRNAHAARAGDSGWRAVEIGQLNPGDRHARAEAGALPLAADAAVARNSRRYPPLFTNNIHRLVMGSHNRACPGGIPTVHRSRAAATGREASFAAPRPPLFGFRHLAFSADGGPGSANHVLSIMLQCRAEWVSDETGLDWSFDLSPTA
jgi:hypothetical protein